MRRSALLVVCLAVFVDMMGFGITLPSLPLYAEQLGGSGVWVGALITVYAVAQFVAAPILGSLSDRYGRRRLLLASLAGSMVSLMLTGLAGTLFMLLLARLVSGAFGGAIAVGQAYAVDLADKRHRTQALGLVGASVGLGFVFGPAIGAGLSAIGLGFTGICLVAAAIAGLNIVAGLLFLPTGPAPSRRRRSHRIVGGGTRLTTLLDALGRGQLRPVLLAMFAVTFAFTAMETTFALLGAARFGLGPAGVGAVLASVGVVMVLVQGGLVARLTERYGHAHTAVAGAALLGLGLVIVPFAPAWLSYIGLGVIAAGQGLLSPTIATIVADAGGPAVGGVLGVSQSAAAAARAIGPLVAGFAYDLGMPLPYVLGALLAATAAGLLWTVTRRSADSPARQDLRDHDAAVAKTA